MYNKYVMGCMEELRDGEWGMREEPSSPSLSPPPLPISGHVSFISHCHYLRPVCHVLCLHARQEHSHCPQPVRERVVVGEGGSKVGVWWGGVWCVCKGVGTAWWGFWCAACPSSSLQPRSCSHLPERRGGKETVKW